MLVEKSKRLGTPWGSSILAVVLASGTTAPLGTFQACVLIGDEPANAPTAFSMTPIGAGFGLSRR